MVTREVFKVEMINFSMLAPHPPGVILEVDGIKIGLDSKGDFNFISHAHFDHLISSLSITTSEPTLELVKVRTGKEFQNEKISGIKTKMFDAGHVLGSKQLWIENSKTYLYSGDINLNGSLIEKPAEVPKADMLIVEATYGRREYVFPPREEEYEKIGKWAEKILEKGEIGIVGAYELGKAQEVIAAINKYASVAPLVTEKISEINKIYEKNGKYLDFISPNTDESEALVKGPFIAVAPMNFIKWDMLKMLEKGYKRKVRGAKATGWNLFLRSSWYEPFILSDHSGFDGLLEYVERTEAKKVYVVHGFKDEFAHELRKRGIDAHVL